MEWVDLIEFLKKHEKTNDPFWSNLIPFAELAQKDEVIGKMYPFMSHYALGISKKPEYPFSWDSPFVLAIMGGKYSCSCPCAGGHGTAHLSEATAERILEFIKEIWRGMEQSGSSSGS